MTYVLSALVACVISGGLWWLYGAWAGLGWLILSFVLACLTAVIAWDHDPLAASAGAFGLWPWMLLRFLFNF